ncbi:MAG: glycerophosphoryl diester phosphodiesterase membrane domain-containing protein, partial [Lachnospiraceae bacterium]|nr:glycerophosphoryl diester phosphodiesterase membrane domain-containing protein [Lachnospiraceae bacterium]
KSSKRMILNNLGQLVIFELFYKGLIVLLMLPVMETALNVSIRLSGYSYVTFDNVFDFAFKPATIPLFILSLLLFLFLLYVEVTSLIVFCNECVKHGKVSATQILLPGLKRSVKVLRHQHDAGVYFSVFLFMVVLYSPMWAGIYERFPQVRYMLKGLNANDTAYKIIMAVFVLMVIIGFSGVFSLFYSVLRKDGFGKSIIKSIKLVFKHPKEILLPLIIWNVVILAVEIAAFFILLVITTIIPSFFTSGNHLLLVQMRIEDELSLYGGMFFSTVGAVLNIAFLSIAFNKYATEDSEADVEYVDAGFTKGGFSKVFTVLMSLIILGNLLTTVFFVRRGSKVGDTLSENAVVEITAHRGDSVNAPENTMSALKSAVENMADYAEIDVQLTKDGVVVLAHDYSLYRICKKDVRIYDLTYDELLEYDFGGWFSEDFKGEQVITLDQAIKYCKGRIKLNIELKSKYSMDELVVKVEEIIRENYFENQCVVTCGRISPLEKMKALNNDIKTGYILSVAYGDFFSMDGVDFFSVEASFLTQENVLQAHLKGKEVHAWTVNTVNATKNMMAMGVDNIITDNPLVVRSVCEDENPYYGFLKRLAIIIQN